MHLHGHAMSVLHQGPGYWDNVSLTNMQNPQRRDVQMLPPSGHIVLQYEANNPGVWPFHCHIAWHLSQVCGVSPISTLFAGKNGDLGTSFSFMLFFSRVTNPSWLYRVFT